MYTYQKGLKRFFLGSKLSLLFSVIIFAQESSIYHNYYLSPFIINPAIAGSDYYPSVELSMKRQWTGINDAPTTLLAAGSMRFGTFGFYNPDGLVNKTGLNLKDKVGLGAAFFSDLDGPQHTTGGLLTYAYHIQLNSISRLSFGLSFSGTYYSLNEGILKPIDPDSYLFSGNENKFRANISSGTYYYSNNYYAGVSFTKLLPDVSAVNENVEEHPSIFLMGGYKFLREKPNNLEQTIVLKRVNEKVSVDLLTKFYILQFNWVALSYSTSGNIDVLFGLHLIKKLYVGYKYEYTTGKIANYTSGSHEFYLGLNLGLIRVNDIRKLAK
jgi:type IX secretion system PorP/SprF family membrane protein